MDEVEVVLWPRLINPWRVFRFCKWTLNIGFGASFWSGIEGREICSVANGLGIAVNDQLLSDIRVMEGAASKVLNKRKDD